jgi:pSer/pThr/pTyr-binding forkhead associated (FHA) protein
VIKCPFCDTTFPENTLFCEECGAFIAPSKEYATDPLAGQPVVESAHASSDRGRYRTLILAIRDGGRFELPLSKEVVLGRLDASRAIFPDVDLTGEDGLEQGISRRHACITQRENDVFIEDLNSLNGTFLNANRLVAELPYPVKDGDQIQLGKLVMTIYLK